jgi:hypothetical protein
MMNVFAPANAQAERARYFVVLSKRKQHNMYANLQMHAHLQKR